VTDIKEADLAKGIDDEFFGVKEMAAKLAPHINGVGSAPAINDDPARAYREQISRLGGVGSSIFPPDKVATKRSMPPVDHMGESLASLRKTMADLQSLFVKLLGDSEIVKVPEGSAGKGDPLKKPVVQEMHEQASEVSSISHEMAALVAQIRESL
jgi:hypothetical protein